MRYYKQLYLSETLRKKKDKVIWKLEHDRMQFHLYLIVLATHGTNQLEFFDSVMLRQRAFSPCKEECAVIGMADSYEDAVTLVVQITEDVLMKTGETKIRSYFEEQMKYDEAAE